YHPAGGRPALRLGGMDEFPRDIIQSNAQPANTSSGYSPVTSNLRLYSICGGYH
ncbi:hypothetical protein SK128_006876, partial [Halocaridina rubra]